MENKNQPAFPVSEEITDRIDSGVRIYTGLTKREYFAAMAMQGILASDNNTSEWLDEKRLATKSTEYADALLTELEKK